MKFCESHWKKLREEIDNRGLSHLVSGSGDEARKLGLVGKPS